MSATNNNPQASGEFLLMAVNDMKFQASADILEDPNVFIGDTGASRDTTVLDLGFKNRRSVGMNESVTDTSRNMFFLQELKEERVLTTVWLCGTENPVNIV